MVNQTMTTFGYPETLVHEYDRWVVLVRDSQVTMGSLVLICKEDAEAFADISAEAFLEQKQAVSDIEATLKAEPFGAVKMNYLMLMMKDPQVHYHVFPRPLEEKTFDGVTFSDPPGPPDVTAAAELGDETLTKLKQILVDNWPKVGAAL